MTDAPSSPRAARAVDHYGEVLLGLLAIYVSIGYQDTQRALTGVQGVLVAAVAVFTLRASAVTKRWVMWVVGGALLMAIVVTVETVIHDTQEPALTYGLLTFALMFLPVAILYRIFEHTTRGIWIQTIIAAICVYLLIGLIWTYGLLFLNAIQSGSAVSPPSNVPSDYLYFSFSTLTTVGFGDVVAHGSTARVLINLEALFGQVFLVVLVARLVSAWRPRGRGDTEDTD